jgi:predicted dehydrogenase
MLTIAIIGYGYWGPNLLRNFSSLENVKVHSVADLRADRLELVKKNYPTIHTTTDIESIFNYEEISAIIIATPVHTHFALSKKALQFGKHVLVEKPISMTSVEAKELIDLAKSMNKHLMVDHTFLYTGAVKKIKQVIEQGEIGNIRYFDSTRINLGLFQPDINVLWDLAAHDLSILLYLLKDRPVSVNATGISHTKNGIENIAYLTLNFNSDLIAHFNCSWSSPVKIRQTLIGGDKKMIVYNDMEPTEKIKIYNTGYSHRTDEERTKILVDYRVSDIYIPQLELKEALLSMSEDFIKTITQNTAPVSDQYLSLEIIKILEASQQSIKNNGKEVYL